MVTLTSFWSRTNFFFSYTLRSGASPFSPTDPIFPIGELFGVASNVYPSFFFSHRFTPPPQQLFAPDSHSNLPIVPQPGHSTSLIPQFPKRPNAFPRDSTMGSMTNQSQCFLSASPSRHRMPPLPRILPAGPRPPPPLHAVPSYSPAHPFRRLFLLQRSPPNPGRSRFEVLQTFFPSRHPASCPMSLEGTFPPLLIPLSPP